jgi:hypothetical protein
VARATGLLRSFTIKALKKKTMTQHYHAPVSTKSLAEEDIVLIDKAKLKIHEVFMQYAPSCRRYREINECAVPAALDLQMDVYACGSTNVKSINGRAALVRGMFLDFIILKIDIVKLTEWGAALWVRSRVNSGTKTAGRYAISTLAFVAQCTGENMFHKTPLVVTQSKPRHGSRAASEPAIPARPLLWRHTTALEETIVLGATPQQRAYAGFFTFLIQSSARCGDGQRSRKLRLEKDSLMGESLMKGKASWTQWAALRKDFNNRDWAGAWMEELQLCNLPGDDFVLLAANVTMDEWIPRPARYGDFSRALHLLLMIYGGESPESVIEFTPHGCRHVQLTAAQQLAQQGHLGVSCLESLGHWERGSKMPKHYDAAACVTELQARKTISDAFAIGMAACR